MSDIFLISQNATWYQPIVTMMMIVVSSLHDSDGNDNSNFTK